MLNKGVLRIAVPMVAILGGSLIARHWGQDRNPDTALPGVGDSIRIGVSSLPEEIFQAEIMSIGIDRLGFKTAPIVQLTYPLLIAAIANGNLDLFPCFADPPHDPFFVNAGGPEKLRKAGLFYRGVMGYQIDKRTAGRYHINNLAQLRDPKIAALFDTDGDGKADLIGCDPGWGCELAIEHHLDAYQLRRTVSVKEGNYTALIAGMLARYREGKPVLFITWSPFWLGKVLEVQKDVVWLEVPFTSFPAKSGSVTAEDTTVDGKNYGYPVVNVKAVGNRNFLDSHPAVTRFLDSVKISPDDINQESLRNNKGENSQADVRKHAEEWAHRHETELQSWLAEARQAPDAPGDTGRAPTLQRYGALDLALNPFRVHKVRLDSAITVAVNSAVRNLRPFLQTATAPVSWGLDKTRTALLAPPPMTVLLLVSFLTWQIVGRAGGIYCVLSLALVGFLGLWEAAMISCSLVVTAVVFCVATGIPVGVLCARSDRFEKLLGPLLDAMQTLPTLVYLVPVVMLFGIGEVSGVIATIVYALPPVIRFTDLGIRQVSAEVVEAARAFGATPRQILWDVQLPLALPTIMAGVSQSVLFALGMTVIASMIAVPGLGLTILQGMNRLDVGTAAVGGLAIVLLAILLDRITRGIVRVTRQRELGE